MCTASWLLNESGYQVFFNRDEQIGRPKAQPPKSFTSENGTRYLMPVDPVGQGSWIATNEYGLTLCLLNFYQGKLPEGNLISRGQLIKNFAGFMCAESIVDQFSQLNLQQYAPFTFVIFDPKLTSKQGHVRALQWDGDMLISTLPSPPLISSSVDAENVKASREKVFHQFNGQIETTESRLAFHHCHYPEKGHLSPCMHRSDANTVSFTHVVLNPKQATVYYQDGSPCKPAPYQQNKVLRRASFESPSRFLVRDKSVDNSVSNLA
ncbi:NRDE family protein [Vibrio sp. MA40-2]|uniref:NRDE family protein n=1 Tax=Vibrio sp. MA40-2 TaxID=3391828 RepID=UPI0039A540DA